MIIPLSRVSRFPILALVLGLLGGGLSGWGETAAPPRFQFGLVTDVQYADKPAAGGRDYRGALVRLRSAVATLNGESLAFTAQLGDLIDGNGEASLTDLRAVLDALRGLRAPLHHVIGNHCLELDRTALRRELGLSSGYYEFRTNGWRFLVLDGMDASVKSTNGSPESAEAAAYLQAEPKLARYNGAVGRRQLEWLKERLAASRRERERVIVFIHHPLLEASSEAGLLLWNHLAVRRELEASGNVAACFNGHDHRGGYASRNGVHYVTLAGLVEAPSNTCAVIRVHGDRLELRGFGSVPQRVLPLTAWPAP